MFLSFSTLVVTWTSCWSLIILFTERSPPIEEVIQAGVVPRFVQFLIRDDFPQLQVFMPCFHNLEVPYGVGVEKQSLIVLDLFTSKNFSLRQHGLSQILLRGHLNIPRWWLNLVQSQFLWNFLVLQVMMCVSRYTIVEVIETSISYFWWLALWTIISYSILLFDHWEHVGYVNFLI